MRRYRIEIFNKDFQLISHASVDSDDVDIRDDYVTLDTSELTVPAQIIVERKNYAVLRNGTEIVYQGVVSDYEYKDGTTEIKCLPLLSLMDVQVYLKRSTLRTTAIETILKQKLEAVYANSDSLQKLTGLSIATSGSTTNTSFSGDDDLVNLYDIAQEALRKYSILCKWDLDVSAKKVSCSIVHISTAAQMTIDLTVPDVIDHTIHIQAISNSFNKIKYFNQDNTSQSIVFYIHPDGTVNTSNSDRITPVIYCERLAQAQELDGVQMTWQEVALGNAKSTMVNSSYDNEITVTYMADSKLIKRGDVGQVYKLIDQNGVIYTSILTGYEADSSDTVMLLFGMIRTSLTSILRMERRS